MSTLPTTQDVRHVREQAEAGVFATFDTVKNPLFAALGAVDAATRTVTDVIAKARTGAAERAEEAQGRVQKALHELQSRVSELPNEVSELRHRLEPAEMRKMAEQYREAAQKAYASLIERGEEVFGDIRNRPAVRQALDSVGSGVNTAQERLEIAVRELNATVDDLRSRFARGSRSIGEKTAWQAQKVAETVGEQVKGTAQRVADAATEAGEQVADTVHDTGEKVSKATGEAGDDAASTARSTGRKVAERAAPPPQRKPVGRRPGDNSARKN